MVLRALANEGHIDASKFSDGSLVASDLCAIGEAGQRIQKAPIYVYDVPNVRFSEMKSIARQMVITHAIKILFIDYLQIIQWDSGKLTRYEQMSNISLGIKQLARELGIPIIVPAQVKRDAQDRMPTMADLKETGQIEQDADVIAFIHHPIDGGNSLLLIEKNRDGKTGNVPIVFKREYIKFYEMERSSK
jgi:replicative DNA helicase